MPPASSRADSSGPVFDPVLLTDATTPSERLALLDVLRGLALLGMILVHFHQQIRLDVTGLEDAIGWFVWMFVEQKAWGMFAFLFGVGFAVLLRRVEARGARVVPLYLRRLAALAVIGVVAEVGFGFSILFEYACWGLVLMFSIQAAFSRVWLSRYRFGPLEWLWRTVTYLRWQPLRRFVADTASV